MENKTAVEWLVEQLDNNLDIKHSWRTKQYIEQAKQLEKEQIEKAFIDVSMEMAKFFKLNADENTFKEAAEQYYKETFKTE